MISNYSIIFIFITFRKNFAGHNLRFPKQEVHKEENKCTVYVIKVCSTYLKKKWCFSNRSLYRLETPTSIKDSKNQSVCMFFFLPKLLADRHSGPTTILRVSLGADPPDFLISLAILSVTVAIALKIRSTSFCSNVYRPCKSKTNI